MEWRHETLPYWISDQKDLLDVDAVYGLLQTTYWAKHRTRDIIEKSLENSLCFSVYGEEGQVGFMRVVTDYATFSWVCDVIIHPDHRRQGLAKWMLKFLLSHEAVRDTSMILATRDAHSLYERFGFKREELMRRKKSIG
ncbi:GNAT family N-acetyltransferase [Thermoactinomyces vulgaris]|uniref:GNAT family N-acetyltransferase n=1 Tax=Thermoactinomyces vulgaris TaxID=2026 RepID=A0ABS0QDK4_THEVU|nr:GNAT family N-acetyltransferase [Thermoactinomyces vulgaris]MBA4550544.1 GNAT family N-acetyltransferase [Thermoactinomyces vulgaris]MBA4595955.1 GNAT family N-acetyltransferase [Thermoactinomyces vulgaris]MBH8587260.1 GNAT family N-acetyltransferase [Thermoactinomyces vulgaris]RMB04323.1 ribosomal protein S18 acetylase RimI-like enzyme [Thermoactinomyces vulgaris]